MERGEDYADLLLSETRWRADPGNLARVFHRIAQEIPAHEARLRNWVLELNIEIDEVKRAYQGKAIIETKYFHLLQ